MSQGHQVTVTPGTEHVQVRLGGELLADTTRPMLLDETGLPTRYYLPREDVRMDQIRATTFRTTCPFKGEASYWSATVADESHDGIAWSYEHPLDAAGGVENFLSFYPGRVQMSVDGRPVTE